MTRVRASRLPERANYLHPGEFVTDEGVHINQVEYRWSLVNPWLRKFRGLSKRGLEHSVRTTGTDGR